MLALLFVLVFFAPLSFIYGRHRARGLKARHTTLGARLIGLAPLPLIMTLSLVLAVIYQSEAPARQRADLTGIPVDSRLDSGDAVVDAGLTVARWLGELELILFMVALPYLLGAAIAAVLVILDANGRISLRGQGEEPAAPNETNDPESRS